MFSSTFQRYRFNIKPFYKGYYYKDLSRKKKIKRILKLFELLSKEYSIILPGLFIEEKATLDEALYYLSTLTKEYLDIDLDNSGNFLRIIQPNYTFMVYDINRFFKVRKNKDLFDPLIALLKRINKHLFNFIFNNYHNEMLEENVKNILEDMTKDNFEEFYDDYFALKEQKIYFNSIRDAVYKSNKTFSNTFYKELIKTYPKWEMWIKTSLDFLNTKSYPLNLFDFNYSIDTESDDDELPFSLNFFTCSGEQTEKYFDNVIQDFYSSSFECNCYLRSDKEDNPLEDFNKKKEFLQNLFIYYDRCFR